MTVFLAAFIGAALGQALTLYIIGMMAQRAQKRQAKAAQEAVQEYHSMMVKERERMREYARMES